MATNTKSTARTTTTTRRPKAAAKVAVTSPVQVRTKVEARGSSPQRAVYAYVGAGQLAIEKSRELSERAIEKSREVSELALGKGVELSSKLVSTIRQPQDLSAKLTGDLGKVYEDLAARGEKVVRSISDSAYTRRAVHQTKVARSQVKAATTSVRKAVDTATEAAREAMKKVS